jgi:spore coat protein CotH
MKKTICIVIVVLISGLAACKKESTPKIRDSSIAALSSQKEILQFKFESKNNSKQLLKDVECHVYADYIVGCIPYISTNKSLIATFTINGAKVTVNGTDQVNSVTLNNYDRPLTFKVTAADGTTKDYKVTLYTFTGLPIFYLETEAPVTSLDDYVKGKISIDANSRYEQLPVTAAQMEMRGRGNSTWGMPKKPYRIKLDKKTELLGMPAAKKWVLLANFADKTLMRNYLALEIGRRFGAAFTPRSRYVEVILNGEYLGNYLLTDQIEVGETRVNIPELKETSPVGDISGGYLLEVDERLDETFWFRTLLQVAFTVKSPENITPAQFNYIKDYVQKIENALYNPYFTDPVEGYTKYINTETFVNWYLVNELLKNNDAVFFSSVFMYKDHNAKLSIGPIWDFDLAIGNANYNGSNDPRGWWVKQSVWINRLFDDPVFVQKVKDRWNVLKGEPVSSLYTFINETSVYLKYSQKENFNKWDVLYNYTWPNPVTLGSYDSEVQHMKEWLSQRISWMDSEINKM